MAKIAHNHSQRRTAGDMFPVIAKYLASNLTQKTFCQQENLNYKTFHYWLKKYRAHQGAHGLKKSTDSGAALLPVHITPAAPTSGAPCEISYPNGITIRFSQPVGAELLRQLIEGCT